MNLKKTDLKLENDHKSTIENCKKGNCSFKLKYVAGGSIKTKKNVCMRREKTNDQNGDQIITPKMVDSDECLRKCKNDYKKKTCLKNNSLIARKCKQTDVGKRRCLNDTE